MRHGPVVTLARSQAFALADRIEPIVRKLGGKAKAARELGVSESVLQKAMSRRADIRISRQHLDEIGKIAGIDVSKWE